MMKQIEMVTECISTCDEIILFGHGYKSHSLRGAQDQYDDVTSLIKYFSILRSYSFFTTICLILHRSVNLIFSSIFTLNKENVARTE